MDPSKFSKNRTVSLLCRNPFLVVFASVAAGILLDRFVRATISQWIVGSSVFLLAVWMVICTKRRRVVFYLLFAAMTFLFASWHHMHWRLYAPTEVSRYIPASLGSSIPVLIEVIATELPSLIRSSNVSPMSTLPGGDSTVLRVRATRIFLGNEWHDASGTIEMFVDGHLTDLTVGGRLRVLGKLSRPPPRINPGERDRRIHSRTDRILSRLHVGFPDCVEVISSKPRSWLNLVEASRNHCRTALERRLSEGNVELGKALLLGTRDGVPRETIDAFFLTGTMHLLAISGLHVGILAFAFMVLVRRGILPYRLALVSVMIFIAGYAILTGARPPVIRAMILIHIVCMSWLTKRQPTAMNSLAVAAVVVLSINPAELFRVGAQLSFVAVASLSWCAIHFATPQPDEPLDRLIWRTRSWQKRLTDGIRQKLWQMTLASLVVWGVTFPLVSHQFHVVSPAAIVLNVVMAIPVACTLFSGVMTFSCDLVCPPVAKLSASICDQSLAVMHRMVEVVQPIPGSHFWTPGYGLAWTVVFYAAALMIGVSIVRLRFRWGVAAMAAWLAIPIAMAAVKDAILPKPMVATFIAVGHGTSVLLEFANGRNLLYDCGHIGIPESCVNSISAVLWSRRICRIDNVVISHADADHYNALPGLLERFSVGSVVVSREMFDTESDSVRFLHESILHGAVPIQTVDHRHALKIDPAVFVRVLHPPSGVEFVSDNAMSITLLVRHQGSAILFPGDIEDDGLERLILQKPIDCDLVMAPHHGSRRSSPEAFSKWSQPNFTVVSCGDRADTRTVATTFERFGQVMRTNECGAITATFTDSGLYVRRFLDGDD